MVLDIIIGFNRLFILCEKQIVFIVYYPIDGRTRREWFRGRKWREDVDLNSHDGPRRQSELSVNDPTPRDVIYVVYTDRGSGFNDIMSRPSPDAIVPGAIRVRCARSLYSHAVSVLYGSDGNGPRKDAGDLVGFPAGFGFRLYIRPHNTCGRLNDRIRHFSVIDSDVYTRRLRRGPIVGVAKTGRKSKPSSENVTTNTITGAHGLWTCNNTLSLHLHKRLRDPNRNERTARTLLYKIILFPNSKYLRNLFFFFGSI